MQQLSPTFSSFQHHFFGQQRVIDEFLFLPLLPHMVNQPI